ncbi:MAG: XRE family transcriptional regulator [Saprospiraceae bacterium]|nr:XRE family transcriptional regulator [Candidatus Opimibacter skivensis]
MGIPLQKVLAEFPKDRQEKIRAKADKYIKEYENLAGLRKDLGITQEEIAQHQGVKQVNISNLEKRNDMLISTLRKYVSSLGR